MEYGTNARRARRLLVALWLWLEKDEAPAGAELVDWRKKVTGRPHFVLFLVECLLVLRQYATELARGNVDAEIMQLFQQQRLRHMRVVMLVQNIADQVGAIMTSGQHIGR